MASSKQFLFSVFAVAAILLPAISAATDYVVGDDKGWTKDFDYQAWAKDKMFMVGDSLVFKYTAPNHNVYKVTGDEFKNCTVPVNADPLTSGNDKIVLATAGNKWYLCGKPDHCSTGQKLSITVMEAGYGSSSAPNLHIFSSLFVAALGVLLVTL